ncbi:MAG: polysaccharide deacetylase family protein [Bacteroidia bacterium]|nr:polysaccharide deacetylase family protein [Bacteroidia bacterium]
MYLSTPLNGSSLPERTLCLTYDDGPGSIENTGDYGPNTLKLARFLGGRNIRATFFMVGKHAERYPALIRQVQRYGHIVANHTYSHPNLINFHAVGGDVAEEIIRTDRLLHNHVNGGVMYFRPPYLDWSPAVAEAANNNLMAALRHVGPIDSDIFTGDYRYWWDNPENPEDLIPINDIANAIMPEIRRVGKGILVLHDSGADGEFARSHNRCYELTRELVNRLSEEGYRFVGLDQIPAIRDAAALPLVCGLKASNNRYVSVEPSGRILVNGPTFADWERIIVKHVHPGRVALRTPDGRYFSAMNGGGGEVSASASSVAAWEVFDVIPIGRNQVAFRTVTGHLLSRSHAEGGSFTARANTLRDWEVFTFENHSI